MYTLDPKVGKSYSRSDSVVFRVRLYHLMSGQSHQIHDS